VVTQSQVVLWMVTGLGTVCIGVTTPPATGYDNRCAMLYLITQVFDRLRGAASRSVVIMVIIASVRTSRHMPRVWLGKTTLDQSNHL